MDVSVVLEQLEGNGYRATAFVPAPLVSEAPTRDEAGNGIRTLVCERFSSAELIHIDVPVTSGENPWLSIAGSWRGHPDIDEVVQNMETFRRELDHDPDRL